MKHEEHYGAPRKGLSLHQVQKLPILQDGGMVEVRGDRIKPGTEMGLGSVRYLSEMPKEGVNINNFERLDRITWGEQIKRMAELGLTQENPPGSGIYVRTDAADKSKYDIYPYSLCLDDKLRPNSISRIKEK